MIRVLLTEVAPGVAEGIRAALADHEDVEVVGYARDGLEAIQMAVAYAPEVLLIHEQLPGISGYEACELTSLAAPGVACALLCNLHNDETVRRAMRAGARAVISPDTGPTELAKMIGDLKQLSARTKAPEYKLATDPSAMPRTIALLSARDGVGKSTLAVNCASALAQQEPGKVALVDLCGQFGSLALLLGAKPSGSIVDLAGYAMEMDLDLVETFLVTHSSGLKVLAGGTRPDPAWTDVLSVDFVARLLGLLRRRYQYIVCDLATTVWPGALYAASRAQIALAVGSLWNLTELHAMGQMVDTFVPQYVATERFRLVVNRSSGRDVFGEDELKKATKRRVWHSVPNDSANVMAAANEGAPAVLSKPGSAYAKNIQEMVDKLLREFSSDAVVGKAA